MIRKFTQEDAAPWCIVRKENLLEINSKDYPSEVILALLHENKPEKVIKQSGKRFMIVYEEENEVVGTASLTKSGEVKNMFVKPSHHHKGVGRKLLKQLEEEAGRKGLKKTFLYSSVTGENFYEKNGYTKIEEVWEEVNGKTYKVTLMEKKYDNNHRYGLGRNTLRKS